MKHQKFSLRRRQMMAMGAGSLAAPAVAMAAPKLMEPVVNFAGEKIVISGRILGAPDGLPLAGAQIEIWQADARGVRAESTREVAVTDGDGRYFAAMGAGDAHRLHYRVSRQGYTARVTQMHAASGVRQRTVTMTRDDEGSTRAAFELTLAPRNALASATPDYVAL